MSFTGVPVLGDLLFYFGMMPEPNRPIRLLARFLVLDLVFSHGAPQAWRHLLILFVLLVSMYWQPLDRQVVAGPIL